MRDDQPIILTKDEIRELICQGVEDALIQVWMLKTLWKLRQTSGIYECGGYPLRRQRLKEYW
jgi:hypothetical protein